MYWINWNLKRPTIESSLMNGSERQAIIEEDLRTPRGLALDIRKQKVYWANNLHFSTFRIERSNVDGTERELVHSGKGQFVFSLAVIVLHNLTRVATDGLVLWLNRSATALFTGLTGSSTPFGPWKKTFLVPSRKSFDISITSRCQSFCSASNRWTVQLYSTSPLATSRLCRITSRRPTKAKFPCARVIASMTANVLKITTNWNAGTSYSFISLQMSKC